VVSSVFGNLSSSFLGVRDFPWFTLLTLALEGGEANVEESGGPGFGNTFVNGFDDPCARRSSE
jgi:hypothetical protein